jgi:hypothetical protein
VEESQARQLLAAGRLSRRLRLRLGTVLLGLLSRRALRPRAVLRLLLAALNADHALVAILIPQSVLLFVSPSQPAGPMFRCIGHRALLCL